MVVQNSRVDESMLRVGSLDLDAGCMMNGLK